MREGVAMVRLRILSGGLTASIIFIWATCANAQGYRPATPTLSPWFNLYQRNPGPLDNYNMFVQPRMDLQQTLNQQTSNIQQNSVKLKSLGKEVNQIQKEGPARPTGSSSTFMNYSHYYPLQGGRANPGQR
jgi:hypothetical protein